MYRGFWHKKTPHRRPPEPRAKIKPRLVAGVAPLQLSAQIICCGSFFRNFAVTLRFNPIRTFLTRLTIIYNRTRYVNEKTGFFDYFLYFFARFGIFWKVCKIPPASPQYIDKFRQNNTIFCAETARLNIKNTAEKPQKLCIKFSYGLLKMLYIY